MLKTTLIIEKCNLRHPEKLDCVFVWVFWGVNILQLLPLCYFKLAGILKTRRKAQLFPAQHLSTAHQVQNKTCFVSPKCVAISSSP